MRQGNDSGRNWPKFTTHLYKSNCQGKKEAQTENMVEHQQESWLNSEMDKNTQRWQERKEGEKKTSFKLLVNSPPKRTQSLDGENFLQTFTI